MKFKLKRNHDLKTPIKHNKKKCFCCQKNIENDSNQLLKEQHGELIAKFGLVFHPKYFKFCDEEECTDKIDEMLLNGVLPNDVEMKLMQDEDAFINLLRSNYYRQQYNVYNELIVRKNWCKWYGDEKCISEEEYYNKLKIYSSDFDEQVEAIYDLMTEWLKVNGQSLDIVWVECPELGYPNKKYKIERNKIFIRKSLIILIRLIVNGGKFKDLYMDLGISLNTLKKYLNAGFILVKDYLQKFFCTKLYWTEERLRSNKITEYDVFFGYVKFLKKVKESKKKSKLFKLKK